MLMNSIFQYVMIHPSEFLEYSWGLIIMEGLIDGLKTYDVLFWSQK